jgi:hypothetical protein
LLVASCKKQDGIISARLEHVESGKAVGRKLSDSIYTKGQPLHEQTTNIFWLTPYPALQPFKVGYDSSKQA